ncbi:hypothetical protein M406DRAFT_102568 [Cryphonectria parasitica EP155]|uniref:Uncharacterized protein n=1 Tax=Cryphonectria parasitica (strain ATCC 38755 / EP155) TaxID=660469 RepID=A0A9P4Y0R4_CRYP1|nr:uncharacterized protein M406DRAFT_102568 [Cryphonectria parasitica EP155]KAF3764461.1 hypothetical protein M406DRAFT_102568 [Cryphonectria parasitica EP155]
MKPFEDPQRMNDRFGSQHQHHQQQQRQRQQQQHEQHYHDLKEDPNKYQTNVVGVTRRETNNTVHSRPGHMGKESQSGHLVHYGAFLLMAGIGFGAGVCYSGKHKKRDGRGHREPRMHREYKHDGRYDGRQRVDEYGRPDDQWTYRDQSVGVSVDRSGYWPDQKHEDGRNHWR